MYLLKHGIKVGTFDPDLTAQILEMNNDFINDRSQSRFTISSPTSGEPVKQGEIRVRGKYRVRPSPGEQYAVFTRKGKTYWPQGRFAILSGTGKDWECTITEKNPGEVSVLVARIDPGSHLWVRQYLKVGDTKDIWVGLEIENLPAGIQINDEVTFRVTS